MNDNNGVGSGNWSKMEKWVEKLENVLNNENIIFLTDNDLIFLVNKELPKKDRITRQTFHNWKNGKFGALDKEIGEQFVEMVHGAMITQKNNLLDKLLNTNDKNWTKMAWILERRFEEWNLKHISESVNKNERTVVNIVAGSNEQKALIDSIINGIPQIEAKDALYYEVPPTPIELKKEDTNNPNNENDNLPF